MEFWLTFNNRAEVLQLPVPPSEFTVKEGSNVNTININSFGEIAVIGKTKLSTIEISSFFPKRAYSFCQYNKFPQPYVCVDMIRKWRISGKPIRIMITGTDINMPCCIEEFEYGEKDATGDVYFTIVLREYRFLSTKKTDVSSTNAQASAKRAVDKVQQNTYTVKAGDNLYLIAKEKMGDGSLYKSLAAKNNIKDPKVIHPGQVLVL